MSNAIIAQEHPRSLVEEIVARRGVELVLTYSYYTVAPPGLQDRAPRSEVFRVPACSVTQNWLDARVDELSPNQEIALHSKVECDGASFHIPMVDFVGRPDDALIWEIVHILKVEMCLCGHLVIFGTGRSFHGYFTDLIREREWHRYLGLLLLLNRNDRRPAIDSRWIGHALVRGFTALRWSHNTDRYSSMPRSVGSYS